MKILVTGGAGFIGSHLVEKLVESNDVVVLDNLQRGKLEYVDKQAKFIKGDVRNLDDLIRVMRDEKIEFVYHLAAHADLRYNVVDDRRMIIEQNYIATYNVLEAMRVNNIKKIVFISTSALYGDNESENPEDNPLISISVYAATKIASEQLVTSYCHTFGMQAWIFRPPQVIGPRGTHGVINDFIVKLSKNKDELEVLGNGKQRRSYLHISDCIDAMLYCVEKSQDKVNTFNIATGDLIDVTRIAQIVLDELGLKNAKIMYTGGESNWIGDVKCIWFSIDKITHLGWKPKYKSEEAVRLTARWARDNLNLLERPSSSYNSKKT